MILTLSRLVNLHYLLPFKHHIVYLLSYFAMVVQNVSLALTISTFFFHFAKCQLCSTYFITLSPSPCVIQDLQIKAIWLGSEYNGIYYLQCGDQYEVSVTTTTPDDYWTWGFQLGHASLNSIKLIVPLTYFVCHMEMATHWLGAIKGDKQ